MQEIYFAAHNGYDGFSDRFGRIFDSKDYRRIYILKGGPGTGKSTLLGRAAKLGEERGLSVTRILCSSDPDSLDGVILDGENKGKIGLLDGTAPHERDAVIAGAVDRLFDLGECRFDDRLEERKNDLLPLYEAKKNAYGKAYRNLAVSGIFNRNIMAETAKRENSREVYDACEKLCRQFSHRENAVGENAFFLSCFGKNGYRTLPSLDGRKKVFSVVGKYGSEYRFLSLLRRRMTELSIPHRAFDHPLMPEYTEAVDLPLDDVLFLANAPDGERIGTEKFGRKKSLLSDPELDLLAAERDKFLSAAVGNFKEASDLHFSMEAVYSSLMDGEKREKMTSRILSEIAECYS